jgi:PAS domain S-box-containing protein
MISVLYVDDEPGMREVAQIFLEDAGGFEFTALASAKKALESPDILSYDAIVSDYMMPGMDGIAFLKAVRQRNADIPFILFTGRGREQVVIEAINNGADFYLQKGGDPDAQFAELAHKIRQAVSRRRAEHLHTESEKRLLDIINFLPDATFAIDRSGRVIAWNRAMEEMTGTSPEDMLGKGDYEYAIPFYGMRRPILIDLIFSPQDETRKKYSFVHADKDILTAETIDATPKGKLCVLWGKAAPLKNSEGQVIGAIESIRDITESKKAQDGLRRSEEKYRELADLLPQMIYELDRDYRITYANRHALTIFGFTDSDLEQGINALSLIESSQHEEVLENARKSLEGYSTEPHEYTAIRKDGSLFPVIIYSTPIYRNETLTGFRGVIIDISAWKKTENDLRENEEKFRSIFENSPYPIAITSVPDYKFLEVNKAFLDASGYTEAEVIGKDPMEMGLIPAAEAVRLISRRLLTGKLENVPLALTAKEGRRIHVQFSIVPVTFNNKPAIVTITVEVTKLKRVEEGLLRKNEELNAAYGQLAAANEELRQNYNDLSAKENALRESEEKFRALVEHSLEGILISDFSGTLLFANRAAGLMVDTPDTESLIGKRNVMEFIAPESQADVLRDFANVAQGNDRYLASYKIVTATKREAWVESIGKRIPFGNTTAILVSLRDITGRKQAEERERESESRFATVFRSSPVALTLVSATDGTFSDINDAFLRSTGYSRDEVVGSTAAALGIFADTGEYKTFTTTLRNQRTVWGMEMKCRIKNGRIRTCRFTSGVIMMDGRPHILSSIEDISEQRKATDALRISEGKLRRLADNAPDMIYRMTLPEGRYEYVSPASLAMTGYTPEEFYADPDLIKRLIHPDWHEYFREQWDALLEKKAPPFYEYQIIDRAGNTRWFNQRNMLVSDEQGNPVAIEGIVTDITRQKNTERDLRRSELRFLAVNENAGSWIWEVDPEGIYRYSSPAVNKLLGYQPDELVGKMHFYDLFDPAVRDDLKAVALAAFSSHEPFRDFINLNRHKNGTPVLMSTSGTPVFDDDGTFTGYCGVDEDITERTASQSAQQALVRSMVGTTGRDALRKITENVRSWLDADSVMVGVIQPDRQSVKVLSMLLDGKQVEGFSYSLKGTPCENVAEKGFCHYPDDSARLFPEARDIVELNIRGYIGTPLRDSRGNVTGILCVLSRNPIPSYPQVQEIMDIIAAKAAAEIERIAIEHELEESRYMLAKAMDLTNLVSWETDPGTGLFIFNDRFYGLYGTSAMREGGYLMAPEKYIKEFVHPEDRESVAAVLNRYRAPADPDGEYQMEHRIIRRDGEVRHIVVRVGISKEPGGESIRIHGANQDITERKRAEEALQQAHKKLHLLTGITRHDISNQLLTLNGFVAVLHKKVTNPALESYFSGITRASSQINAMIVFTKEYEKIGVHAPVWQVLATVVDDAGKGILPGQVTLNNDLPAGTEVFADPLILKVFYNLLDNSVRHGMRVTEIRVSCHDSVETLVVVWEDNGIGIGGDEKDLIFERGFGKNTGLGMFLSREILSLTGITITETGVAGVGARFEMVVPKGAWRRKNGAA